MTSWRDVGWWLPYPTQSTCGAIYAHDTSAVHRRDWRDRPEHTVADVAEDGAAGAAAPARRVAHDRSVNRRQWLAQYSGSRSGSTGTHQEQAPRFCSGQER